LEQISVLLRLVEERNVNVLFGPFQPCTLGFVEIQAQQVFGSKLVVTSYCVIHHPVHKQTS